MRNVNIALSALAFAFGFSGAYASVKVPDGDLVCSIPLFRCSYVQNKI